MVRDICRKFLRVERSHRC